MLPPLPGTLPPYFKIVMYCIEMCRVGARECGFAIRLVRELVMYDARLTRIAKPLSRTNTVLQYITLIFEIEGAGCRGGAATLLIAR